MEKRQLAAIMFSDIAGYTAMMQKDESVGLSKAKIYRRILEEKVTAHGGEIVDHYGDGSLTIFFSSIEAVKCAQKVQQSVQQHSIPLRIGIHLGDISIIGTDVFGDGVNVASRIESMGVSGSVILSERIQKDLLNHPELKCTSLGKFLFKNVKDPIEIFALEIDNIPTPSREQIVKTLKPSGKFTPAQSPYYKGIRIVLGFLVFISLLLIGWKFNMLQHVKKGNLSTVGSLKSLAILPFDNFTGNEDLDYFVSGMHSSLIGDFGKLSALRVISKTTSNAYKNVDKPISKIASELNVDAIVEASVTCLGDSICIQVQLVSTYPEEKQIWVRDYFEEKSKVLNLYNRVTKQISNEINVVLTPDEEKGLEKARVVDTAAYEFYLKGLFYLDQIDSVSLHKASEYFKLAMSKDPTWAAPHAGLSSTIAYQMQMDFITTEEGTPLIHKNLKRALELDSNSFEVYHQKAITETWTNWNWEEAERAYLKALKLKPSDALTHAFYAHYLMIMRRQKEAIYHGETAKRLDPLRPFILGLYAVVALEVNECDKAQLAVEKALELEPDHWFTKSVLGGVYECLGDENKAFELWKKYAWWDEETISEIERVYQEKGKLAATWKTIEVNEETYKNGGRISTEGQANRYLEVKNFDKAFFWFEKAYEERSPGLPYYSTSKYYNLLKDDPRYIALLKKMNLPTK